MSFLLLLRAMREISNHPQCPPHLLHMPPTHQRPRAPLTSAPEATMMTEGFGMRPGIVGLCFRDPPETLTDLGKIFRDQHFRSAVI